MISESAEMTAELHVTELLPAHALECLDLDEERLVVEHLATCAICRAEFESLQFVTDQLALAAPNVAPPAALKKRLMERARPKPSLTIPESRPSWAERLAVFWRRAAPVWGAVSLVLALAWLVNNLILQQRAATPTKSMRTVVLTGADAAPDATGTIVISLDGEHGTLVVDGLPPLDEAQQYQLWLIKNGERTSGGVFSVSSEGYGALWVSAPLPLSTYSSFGVTIEPAGGSPGPTGDKVLGDSL